MHSTPSCPTAPGSPATRRRGPLVALLAVLAFAPAAQADPLADFQRQATTLYQEHFDSGLANWAGEGHLDCSIARSGCSAVPHGPYKYSGEGLHRSFAEVPRFASGQFDAWFRYENLALEWGFTDGWVGFLLGSDYRPATGGSMGHASWMYVGDDGYAHAACDGYGPGLSILPRTWYHLAVSFGTSRGAGDTTVQIVDSLQDAAGTPLCTHTTTKAHAGPAGDFGLTSIQLGSDQRGDLPAGAHFDDVTLVRQDSRAIVTPVLAARTDESNAILLEWTPSAVGPTLSYQVFRGRAPDSVQPIGAPVQGTRYKDTGLATGVYYYQVAPIAGGTAATRSNTAVALSLRHAEELPHDYLTPGVGCRINELLALKAYPTQCDAYGAGPLNVTIHAGSEDGLGIGTVSLTGTRLVIHEYDPFRPSSFRLPEVAGPTPNPPRENTNACWGVESDSGSAGTLGRAYVCQA